MPHVLTPQGYNQYVQSEAAEVNAGIEAYQVHERQPQHENTPTQDSIHTNPETHTEIIPSLKEKEAILTANIQRVGDEVIDMRRVAIEKAKNPAGPDFHEYGLAA